MKRSGTLYLIPVHLGAPEPSLLSPQAVSTAHRLRHFVVENEKSARAFLKSINTPVPQAELLLSVLDEHTSEGDVEALLEPLLQGNDCGLMSEAGCPGIADPGSNLIRLAHSRNITVVPFTGPSSIILGLMASGLNGQKFRFHGYLSREKSERREQLKNLSKDIVRSGETQLFIETPYRNEAMLDDLLDVLPDDMLLCIACDLQSPTEFVKTRPVAGWKKERPSIDRRPCIFLLGQSVIVSPQRSAKRHQPPQHRR